MFNRQPVRPVVRDILSELKYWRAIRLDFPSRKQEALHHIDRLLEELHTDNVKADNE